MGKVIEIVRLSEGGVSQRDIAAVTRSSLRTVSKTVKASRAWGCEVRRSGGQGRDGCPVVVVWFTTAVV